MLESSEEMAINFDNLPNEILLQIFSNLNDTTLLSATHVSKRWKYLSKESFATKYNGSSERKYYTLEVFCENILEERKQYLERFCSFGENIRAISIKFVEHKSNVVTQTHWLIRLIRLFCNSITKVKIVNGKQVDLANIIEYMPDLTHLSLTNLTVRGRKWTEFGFQKLTHFSANQVLDLDDEDFAVFFYHNPQIQDVGLFHCTRLTNDVIYMISHELKQLKSLNLRNEGGFSNYNSAIIEIESLTSLGVRIDNNSFIHVLRSIQGCKNIEHLAIYQILDHITLDINHINLMCSFNSLKKLQMDNFKVPIKLLRILVQPNLDSLSMKFASALYETQDELISVVETCHRLSSLTLFVSPLLPQLNYDFYTRFADVLASTASNLTVELCSEILEDKVILTRDEVRLKIDTNEESVLYWKGYDAAYSSSKANLLELDDNILRKTFYFLDGNNLYALHRTCKKAKQLVEKHLPPVVFCSSLDTSSSPTEVIIDDKVFCSLGEFILRMEVYLDDSWADEDEEIVAHQIKSKKHFEVINKYCRSLIELQIDGVLMSESILFWPDLRRLYFREVNSQTLRLFYCPELRELEIKWYFTTNVPFECADAFENLTVLKFANYSEHVENFLCSLKQKICGQLKVLSLSSSQPFNDWFNENLHHRWIILTNIITRFRKLVTLRVLMPGIEHLNVKFLFENCSMLVEMAIEFMCQHQYRHKYYVVLEQVKLNCKQMNAIELVGNCSCSVYIEVIYTLFRDTETKVKVTHCD